MKQTIIILKAEKNGYRRQRAFSFDGNNINTSAATSWITYLFMFPNHGLLTVLWGIHLKTSFRHLLSNKNYVCGMKLQKYIFSSTLFQSHLFNYSFSSVHFQLCFHNYTFSTTFFKIYFIQCTFLTLILYGS